MISIILINYNSSNILALENLIINILSNKSNIKLYLVDNGSSDNSNVVLLKLLKEHDLPYRYYRVPYNIGFVRAVKIAISNYCTIAFCAY
jgi:glycosyltransferase involved in cell wall biosynthesis